MPAISYSFSISVEKLETILRDWNHTSHNDNEISHMLIHQTEMLL